MSEEQIDIKKLGADMVAHDRASWSATVEAAKTPEPIGTRVRVWDHNAYVMAPVDPDEQRAFLEQRAIARAAAKAKADAESQELAAYQAMSPIERAKLPDAVRKAYDATIAKKERPF